MSRLRVYDQRDPVRPLTTLVDHALIAKTLDEVGVRFERWEANKAVAPGAPQEEVVAAYADDIARLKREKGYQA
ncbi:MAG: cupin, partial [Rhodanobacteraceae bacterium]